MGHRESSDTVTKLTEKTLISLHVVVLIVGIVIWNMKIGSRLEAIEVKTQEMRAYEAELKEEIKALQKLAWECSSKEKKP